MSNEEVNKNSTNYTLLSAGTLFFIAIGIVISVVFFHSTVASSAIGAIIGALVYISIYSFVQGVTESKTDKDKAMNSFSKFFAGVGIGGGLLVGFFLVEGVIPTIVCAIIGILFGVSGCIFTEGVLEYKINKTKDMDSLGGGLVVLGLAIGISVGLFGFGNIIGTIVCAIVGVLVSIFFYIFIQGVIEYRTDKNEAIVSFIIALVFLGLACGILIGFFIISKG